MKYEYLIIGAGPAGLQLGYYLQKENRNFAILEAGDCAGAFFKKFPRHRTLISINKAYTGYSDPEVNLRWDWNSLLCEDERFMFKNYTEDYFPSADRLVDYLKDFASHYQLPIKTDTRVVEISGKEGHFRVTDQNGQVHEAECVITATGLFKPFTPDIPGIEHTEPYTSVSVDAKDFTNKNVLIIGKGNSAFETADHLVPRAALIHVCSPNPLKLAWQTHFVGNLRAVNNNLLDTYQLKSQNGVLDATIEKIEKTDKGFEVTFNYTHAHGEREVLCYDRIINSTGFKFDTSLFAPETQPELAHNDRLPAQTRAWESTNIPGLYFAGTIMQMRDYKECTSGFIHGFRYNVRTLFNELNLKRHGVAWPTETYASNPDTLTKEVLARINKTSALWQLFGFLGDVLVVDESKQQASLYKEMVVADIEQGHLGQCEQYYVITLEYGKNHTKGDPFAATRVRRDDVNNAGESNFLHPIIRRYCRGELVNEHHIIEDLKSEWHEPEHIEPLRAYFQKQLVLAMA